MRRNTFLILRCRYPRLHGFSDTERSAHSRMPSSDGPASHRGRRVSNRHLWEGPVDPEGWSELSGVRRRLSFRPSPCRGWDSGPPIFSRRDRQSIAETPHFPNLTVAGSARRVASRGVKCAVGLSDASFSFSKGGVAPPGTPLQGGCNMIPLPFSATIAGLAWV